MVLVAAVWTTAFRVGLGTVSFPAEMVVALVGITTAFCKERDSTGSALVDRL